MAAKINISDWHGDITALKDFTEPYQLGIQLGIDSSKLDEIEGNHPGISTTKDRGDQILAA